jgi:hypothetical protein
MTKKNLVFYSLIISSLVLLSSLYIPLMVVADPMETKASLDTKVGFSWINGPVGGSEFVDIGYKRAQELGCQIEHRDYTWGDLTTSTNWQVIYEWSHLYLDRYPSMDSSVALSVISTNYTSYPPEYNFTRYTEESSLGNITRFNDASIVSDLKDFTDFLLMEIPELDYLSFGSEINRFFEMYYDFNAKNMTSTVMLSDYSDLCQQLYDHVKTNHSDISIMSIFSLQKPQDLQTAEALLPYFANCSDFFAVSPRIFTDKDGYLVKLSIDDVIERYQGFVDLIGDEKFAITSTYTISDYHHSGSQAYQSNFVQIFFEVIDVFADQLEFACWYTLYDYPPGYLQMIYNPYLEFHSTAGLFDQNGEAKLAYYSWTKALKDRDAAPDYWAAWKIVIIAIVLAAILGFITFTYVKEGLMKQKQELSDSTEKEPDSITFTSDKEKTDE